MLWCIVPKRSRIQNIIYSYKDYINKRFGYVIEENEQYIGCNLKYTTMSSDMFEVLFGGL